jgi:uncharacterized protein
MPRAAPGRARYPAAVPEVELLSLAEHAHVAITTFRRSGERVTVPVWVARLDDALVVWTAGDTGKVKRIRNDPRVELTPCSASGALRPGAATVPALAEVCENPATLDAVTVAMRRKYGIRWRVATLALRIAGRRAPRVVLHIRGA